MSIGRPTDTVGRKSMKDFAITGWQESLDRQVRQCDTDRSVILGGV